MPVEVLCNSCGKKIITKFLGVGKNVKCKFCKNKTIIPEKPKRTSLQELNKYNKNRWVKKINTRYNSSVKNRPSKSRYKWRFNSKNQFFGN